MESDTMTPPIKQKGSRPRSDEAGRIIQTPFPAAHNIHQALIEPTPSTSGVGNNIATNNHEHPIQRPPMVNNDINAE